MNNKPKQITGIGYYLSDTNSLKSDTMNIRYVEVVGKD